MPSSDFPASQAPALTRRELRELREREVVEAGNQVPDAIEPPSSAPDTIVETEPGFTVEPEPFTPASDAAESETLDQLGGLFAPTVAPASLPAPTPAPMEWADAAHAPTALAWVRPDDIGLPSVSDNLDGHAPSLLADAPLRSAAPWSVLAALLTLIALVAGYAVTLILWPLHAVAPAATAAAIAPTTSAPAEITWTEEGFAAVGVRGLGTISQSTEAVPMASVTKVVSALMVLEEQPLELGDAGESYEFTWSDQNDYNSYRWRNESALDVPVGGELTTYQLLQGTMISSANNYINRLAREIWGTDAAFEAATAQWLRDRNLTGITVTEPSGISSRNTADPASLIALAELAMTNPVLSEIAGTETATLPGAGEISNSNPLLSQPGVTGLKTGSLTSQRTGTGQPSWNLLATKDVALGETTVLLSAAMLGFPDNDTRVAEAESLFAQVESQLAAIGDAVTVGTVVGTVETIWGESAEIVTNQPTRAIVWNGTAATHTVSIDLGDHREEGDIVGTLTTTGPLDTSVAELSLSRAIEGPSILWRLTHPLELFGLR